MKNSPKRDTNLYYNNNNNDKKSDSHSYKK